MIKSKTLGQKSGLSLPPRGPFDNEKHAKMLLLEKGHVQKKRPLPGAQQCRAQNLSQDFFFAKKVEIELQIAMSGATDLVKPLNPFFLFI